MLTCHPSFERNQADSPFLRLPAELRLDIYRLVLDEATLYFPSDESVRRVGLYLPQTCRQINKECASFLETYTTLYLTQDFTDALHTFNGTLSYSGHSFHTVREPCLSENIEATFGELFGDAYNPYSRTPEEISNDWGHLRRDFPSLERVLIEERYPESFEGSKWCESKYGLMSLYRNVARAGS